MTGNDASVEDVPRPFSGPVEVRVIPGGWADDPLGKFLQSVHENSYHIYLEHPKIFAVLRSVHCLFGEALVLLSDHADVFSSTFFPRAFASGNAAIRVALGGQLWEAYRCIRGCIEYAIYGHKISSATDPGAMTEVFLRRHDDDEARKKQKNEFAPGGILKSLCSQDPEIGEVLRNAYERTIDYGAHPNPLGHIAGLDISEDGKALAVNLTAGKDVFLGGVFKLTVEVGIGVVKLFHAGMRDGAKKEMLGEVIDEVIREGNGIEWKKEFPVDEGPSETESSDISPPQSLGGE